MHTESLPEKTKRLLQAVSTIEEIGDFLLIGGTALALHAGHRVSEDLDFAFIEGEKLPRRTIQAIVKALQSQGLRPEFIDNAAAAIDFSESTLDILDYQQDYSVDGVKLTFFKFEEPVIFKDVANRKEIGHVTIASIAELFDSKSLIFSRFCRSRDAFDLWWLMEYGGFDVSRMSAAFSKLSPSSNFPTAVARIRRQSYDSSDQGYLRLDPQLPDKDAVKKLLSEKIQLWLEEQAMQILNNEKGHRGDI